MQLDKNLFRQNFLFNKIVNKMKLYRLKSKSNILFKNELKTISMGLGTILLLFL